MARLKFPRYLVHMNETGWSISFYDGRGSWVNTGLAHPGYETVFNLARKENQRLRREERRAKK